MAEELTQETFFKAMRSLDDFRGDCEVRVWLCKIAKNTWFTYCKKANRHVELGNPDDKSSEDFIQLIENKDIALAVHRILHELNEPYKEIFTLRIFGELSFKVIDNESMLETAESIKQYGVLVPAIARPRDEGAPAIFFD